MTIIAGILAFVLIVQYVLNARERKDLIAVHEKQLASFADRIQHPEIRQVEPGPTVEYETPRDEAELAQVGQIVPDFVQVGETDAQH